MISYDFDYYKPVSIDEALQLYRSLQGDGKQPVFYSGGTEIITLGRVNRIVTGAVIDLKGIPECLALQLENDQLVIGAAVTLTTVQESNLFPLLSKVISEIAEHTARNKITLGGNICGNIYYREAVLPLLLTTSQVVIASGSGLKTIPIQDVFDRELRLADGEFLVQLITDRHDLHLPFYSVKKRRQWDIGYPLITIAALKKEEQVRTAFSGLCSFPFRDQTMEEILNDTQLSMSVRIDEAIKHLPGTILDNVEGSAEYRLFVLKNMLTDALDTLN